MIMKNFGSLFFSVFFISSILNLCENHCVWPIADMYLGYNFFFLWISSSLLFSLLNFERKPWCCHLNEKDTYNLIHSFRFEFHLYHRWSHPSCYLQFQCSCMGVVGQLKLQKGSASKMPDYMCQTFSPVVCESNPHCWKSILWSYMLKYGHNLIWICKLANLHKFWE